MRTIEDVLDEMIGANYMITDSQIKEIREIHAAELATDTNVGDTISRQAAIDALKNAEVSFTVESDIDFTEHKREVQEIVDGVIAAQTKALEQLPPTPERTQWIPTAERLPDKDGEYLCCLRVRDNPSSIDKWVFSYGHFRLLNYNMDELVTAWMPLPPVYQEEGEKT